MKADCTERVQPGTTGHRILDTVYRKVSAPPPPPPVGTDRREPPLPLPDTFRTNHQTITLTADQRAAFALAMAAHPISSINAAFGTGKTLLAAIIAAHYDFLEVRLLRYISETAFLDDAPATPADIHEILKSLGSQFDSALASSERMLCSRFSRGRTLYEQYARNPERSMHMSEKEIEEYILAERKSQNILELTTRKPVMEMERAAQRVESIAEMSETPSPSVHEDSRIKEKMRPDPQ
ncbi:hypothetical protein OSTOST_00767 [Ostertagia ostertagi]